MNRNLKIRLGSIIAWSLISAIGVASPLTVSTGRAAQRAGTKMVDVYYNVSGGTAPYSVTLEGSQDGGVTWTLPVTSVSGDVGSGVTAGANRKVTWDAGADWEGQVSENVRFRVNVTDTTLGGFVLIPAGSFQMGDSFAEFTTDERPVHSVNVSAFFMARHETTKALWDDVRAWGLNNGYTDLLTGGGKEANHPVHTLNWYFIVKWCNARSEKDGLTPCYTLGGAVFRTGANSGVACNFAASGYRLPTEAEWEKAARGGLSSKRFPWGDTISHSEANSWAYGAGFGNLSGDVGLHPTYDDGTPPSSSPVGSFAPNGYGLYDMAGNMWEWCWDFYGISYYGSSPASDPRGPSVGPDRVYRGGGWNSGAVNCRVAKRVLRAPGYNNNFLGFRIARSSVP